ncbi:MAG: hypothetical protein R3C26_03375 [Calditrichia bacterium]
MIFSGNIFATGGALGSAGMLWVLAAIGYVANQRKAVHPKPGLFGYKPLCQEFSCQ